MTSDNNGVTQIRTAFISVNNKFGLSSLAASLVASGVQILSTGGTAKMLTSAGFPVTQASEYTNSPEMLAGRVKTLHPKIFGGILCRPGVDDETIATQGLVPIDLVVVNLYPFERTVAVGAAFEECVEQIDIGGPALIRAAAKNHERVTVVTDPVHYPKLAEEISMHGGVDLHTRKRLAALAFGTMVEYDKTIHAYLFNQSEYVPFLAGMATPTQPGLFATH